MTKSESSWFTVYMNAKIEQSLDPDSESKLMSNRLYQFYRNLPYEAALDDNFDPPVECKICHILLYQRFATEHYKLYHDDSEVQIVNDCSVIESSINELKIEEIKNTNSDEISEPNMTESSLNGFSLDEPINFNPQKRHLSLEVDPCELNDKIQKIGTTNEYSEDLVQQNKQINGLSTSFNQEIDLSFLDNIDLADHIPVSDNTKDDENFAFSPVTQDNVNSIAPSSISHLPNAFVESLEQNMNTDLFNGMSIDQRISSCINESSTESWNNVFDTDEKIMRNMIKSPPEPFLEKTYSNVMVDVINQPNPSYSDPLHVLGARYVDEFSLTISNFEAPKVVEEPKDLAKHRINPAPIQIESSVKNIQHKAAVMEMPNTPRPTRTQPTPPSPQKTSYVSRRTSNVQPVRRTQNRQTRESIRNSFSQEPVLEECHSTAPSQIFSQQNSTPNPLNTGTYSNQPQNYLITGSGSNFSNQPQNYNQNRTAVYVNKQDQVPNSQTYNVPSQTHHMTQRELPSNQTYNVPVQNHQMVKREVPNNQAYNMNTSNPQLVQREVPNNQAYNMNTLNPQLVQREAPNNQTYNMNTSNPQLVQREVPNNQTYNMNTSNPQLVQREAPNNQTYNMNTSNPQLVQREVPNNQTYNMNTSNPQLVQREVPNNQTYNMNTSNPQLVQREVPNNQTYNMNTSNPQLVPREVPNNQSYNMNTSNSQLLQRDVQNNQAYNMNPSNSQLLQRDVQNNQAYNMSTPNHPITQREVSQMVRQTNPLRVVVNNQNIMPGNQVQYVRSSAPQNVNQNQFQNQGYTYIQNGMTNGMGQIQSIQPTYTVRINPNMHGVVDNGQMNQNQANLFIKNNQVYIRGNNSVNQRVQPITLVNGVQYVDNSSLNTMGNVQMMNGQNAYIGENPVVYRGQLPMNNGIRYVNMDSNNMVNNQTPVYFINNEFYRTGPNGTLIKIQTSNNYNFGVQPLQPNFQ